MKTNTDNELKLKARSHPELKQQKWNLFIGEEPYGFVARVQRARGTGSRRRFQEALPGGASRRPGLINYKGGPDWVRLFFFDAVRRRSGEEGSSDPSNARPFCPPGTAPASPRKTRLGAF